MPRGEPRPHCDELTPLLCTLPEGLSLANCTASLDFHAALLAAAAEVAECWHTLVEPALGYSQVHTCSSRNKTLTFTPRDVDLCGRTHPTSWSIVL